MKSSELRRIERKRVREDKMNKGREMQKKPLQRNASYHRSPV